MEKCRLCAQISNIPQWFEHEFGDNMNDTWKLNITAHHQHQKTRYIVRFILTEIHSVTQTIWISPLFGYETHRV